LWTALPNSLTNEQHPNVKSLVFSLYQVGSSIDAAALTIQTGDVTRVCDTSRPPSPSGGCAGPTSRPPEGLTKEQSIHKQDDDGGVAQDATVHPHDGEDAARVAAGNSSPVNSRPREQSLADLNTEASVLMVRRVSVTSVGPLDNRELALSQTGDDDPDRDEDCEQRDISGVSPDEDCEQRDALRASGVSPDEPSGETVMEQGELRVSSPQDKSPHTTELIRRHSNHGLRQLIFECLIDLTKTEYLSKHFTGLHDIEALPAHMDDGHRSFTILLRCQDGIFFPTMETSSGTGGSNHRSELDLTKPAPTSYGFLLSKIQSNTIAGGSTFLQHNNLLDHEWDFVDGDAAREAEARQQKTESMSLGDIKALGTASIALRRIMEGLKSCADQRREHIDNTLALERDGVVLASVRGAVTTATCATCATLAEDRRAKIASLKEAIETRRAVLSEKQKGLSLYSTVACPSSPTTSSVNVTSTTAEIRDQLQQARRQLANEVVEYFQVSPSANSILGVKLPTGADGSLPETAEHGMAISHVCHAIVVYARMFSVSLPHPIHLAAPGRCRIYERQGAPRDSFFPLYPVKNSERGLLRRGLDLLRQDIVSAAYNIHSQRQADGLPLALAMEKLLVGR
jgi:hypothetical protein